MKSTADLATKCARTLVPHPLSPLTFTHLPAWAQSVRRRRDHYVINFRPCRRLRRNLRCGRHRRRRRGGQRCFFCDELNKKVFFPASRSPLTRAAERAVSRARPYYLRASALRARSPSIAI